MPQHCAATKQSEVANSTEGTVRLNCGCISKEDVTLIIVSYPALIVVVFPYLPKERTDPQKTGRRADRPSFENHASHCGSSEDCRRRKPANSKDRAHRAGPRDGPGRS